MTDSPIPPDVRAFVVRHIDSIAQMEALQLLHADAAALWTDAALADRLYIPQESASKVLERLCALGVAVRVNNGVRYCCAHQALETSVGRVVHAYNCYLIPITNLIHDKSASRIREFADAFQFVKGR